MLSQMSRTLRRLCMVAAGLPILLGSATAVVVAGEPKISQEEVHSCDFKTPLSKQWTTIGTGGASRFNVTDSLMMVSIAAMNALSVDTIKIASSTFRLPR